MLGVIPTQRLYLIYIPRHWPAQSAPVTGLKTACNIIAGPSKAMAGQASLRFLDKIAIYPIGPGVWKLN
jgi:hypothetical protein